ncbi:hypothetical protein LINGRAHAP2_LOCUS33966 [Linum grandiflorum]
MDMAEVIVHKLAFRCSNLMQELPGRIEREFLFF